MLKAFKKGLLAIKANKSLIVLLWGTNLVLALAVVFPLLNWLGRLNWTAETDVIGDPFSLPLLFEAFHADGGSVLLVLTSLLNWVVVVAVTVNVFLSGGILAALVDGGPLPRRERFWSGAGRFFPRFLLLFLLGLLAALAVLIPMNIGLGSLNYAISQRSDSDLLGFVTTVFQFALSAVVVFFFVLSVQYARVHTVIKQGLGAWKAFTWGMEFVVRNLFATVGLGLCFALAGLATTLIYFLAQQGLKGFTWGPILLLVLAQQLLMFIRSGLRLGLASAEIDLFQQRRMVPQFAPIDEEQPIWTGEDQTRLGMDGDAHGHVANAEEDPPRLTAEDPGESQTPS